jgi:hypothetical protein
MTPSPIFQFIVENPLLAFFLAWPTALVLIAVAWCTTTLLTNTFSTLVNLVSQMFALVLTLVRGYPPKEMMYERIKRDAIFGADEETGKPPKDS